MDTNYTLGTRTDSGEPVFLTPEERRRHIEIIGKTGTGKSTLLQNLMCADFASGRGFAFIDPHGDQAAAIADCSAAIRMGRRIASPGMLLEAKPLRHLICSRPMFLGGVKDEADQHDSAGRVGSSDSGTVCAGGQDGARPYPRRVHGDYRFSP